MDIAVVDHRSVEAPAKLAASLRSTGFAVLVNHPIPAELISTVQREWLDFFDSDAKFDFLPEPGHQDGFHPMSVAETAIGADAPDLKEFFHWYPWGLQPPRIGASAAELHSELAPHGYRLLHRLPQQLSETIIDRLVDRFGSLPEILSASAAELESVEGIGAATARHIRDGLARLVEASIFERYE